MAMKAYTKGKENNVILEEYSEGIYVWFYEGNKKVPIENHRKDTWREAEQVACDEYGIVKAWEEVPDPCVLGPHKKHESGQHIQALAGCSKDHHNCVILEAYKEGVYIWLFEENSVKPVESMREDDFEHAKETAQKEYGVVPDSWEKITDPCIMGDH